MSPDFCPWCKFNSYRCSEDESKSSCDFRNLPYEKDVILARLKLEACHVQSIKERILVGSENIGEATSTLVDLIKGMQIMVDRLVVDFRMSGEEVRKEVGFGKDTFIQKARIAFELGKLRKLRRKVK